MSNPSTWAKMNDLVENNNSPNILYKTKCTVIGAMQYNGINGKIIRDQITSHLSKYNIIVYNHYNQPFLDIDAEESLVKQNKINEWMDSEQYDKVTELRNIRLFDLKLIDLSDFVIFLYSPEIPTCGSYEEFFEANRSKKPIFFVNTGTKKKTPAWVLWTIPHKYIYSSLEEVYKVLDEIDSGKRAIDSDRWKLLKKNFR